MLWRSRVEAGIPARRRLSNLWTPVARYVTGQSLCVDGGYLTGTYTSHG
jgi:hypothetical protein